MLKKLFAKSLSKLQRKFALSLFSNRTVINAPSVPLYPILTPNSKLKWLKNVAFCCNKQADMI